MLYIVKQKLNFDNPKFVANIFLFTQTNLYIGPVLTTHFRVVQTCAMLNNVDVKLDQLYVRLKWKTFNQKSRDILLVFTQIYIPFYDN